MIPTRKEQALLEELDEASSPRVLADIISAQALVGRGWLRRVFRQRFELAPAGAAALDRARCARAG